jgi:hypothetical protein
MLLQVLLSSLSIRFRFFHRRFLPMSFPVPACNGHIRLERSKKDQRLAPNLENDPCPVVAKRQRFVEGDETECGGKR